MRMQSRLQALERKAGMPPKWQTVSSTRVFARRGSKPWHDISVGRPHRLMLT